MCVGVRELLDPYVQHMETYSRRENERKDRSRVII